uniref:Regulatory protein sdiA lactone, quorum sensing, TRANSCRIPTION n=1 Tax=Siphoviridae sp. ct5Px37 TaxID=2826293 RepID=A0A8S5N4J2_9CAUD|nr:MAG TPA: Regulatory protein sdiA lactone, quorum sensing, TRANSCRIPTION [Siphoviridae sp. ct5Px37]
MDEQMTDYQFQTFLKMILEILNGCRTIEEAKEKVESLLKN